MVRHLSRGVDVVSEHAEHVRPALYTWTCTIPVLVLINLVQHFLGFCDAWEPEEDEP